MVSIIRLGNDMYHSSEWNDSPSNGSNEVSLPPRSFLLLKSWGTTSLKKTLSLLDSVTTSSSTSDVSLMTPEDSYSPLANFMMFKNESSLTGSVFWPAAIKSLNHLRALSGSHTGNDSVLSSSTVGVINALAIDGIGGGGGLNNFGCGEGGYGVLGVALLYLNGGMVAAGWIKVLRLKWEGELIGVEVHTVLCFDGEKSLTQGVEAGDGDGCLVLYLDEEILSIDGEGVNEGADEEGN